MFLSLGKEAMTHFDRSCVFSLPQQLRHGYNSLVAASSPMTDLPALEIVYVLCAACDLRQHGKA